MAVVKLDILPARSSMQLITPHFLDFSFFFLLKMNVCKFFSEEMSFVDAEIRQRADKRGRQMQP